MSTDTTSEQPPALTLPGRNGGGESGDEQTAKDKYGGLNEMHSKSKNKESETMRREDCWRASGASRTSSETSTHIHCSEKLAQKLDVNKTFFDGPTFRSDTQGSIGAKSEANLRRSTRSTVLKKLDGSKREIKLAEVEVEVDIHKKRTKGKIGATRESRTDETHESENLKMLAPGGESGIEEELVYDMSWSAPIARMV